MNNTRRDFLKIGAAGAAAGFLPRAKAAVPQQASVSEAPNFLFINVDQWSLSCIGTNGDSQVKTPALDQLIRDGMQFKKAYTANPVCGPARAAWFTSRTPSETGCLFNDVPIVSNDIPDFGEWFSHAGYETVHMGKWHFSGRDVQKSFEKVPVGAGMGEFTDPACARATAGFLASRTDARPFLAVVGLHNPHDCCEWWNCNTDVPKTFPIPELETQLPSLPPNYNVIPDTEPAAVRRAYRPLKRAAQWDDRWWKFYLWSYYRYIEMVDAQIGYILDALKHSPYAENTLVILTADHGDGHGCHTMNGKQYLYEEVCNIPFVIYGPRFLRRNGCEDAQHLISHMDIFPTLCDYAGIRPPEVIRGVSLRPLIEGGTPADWRDFIRVETLATGRMGCDGRFKYIEYKNDPAVQLFDLQKDPYEMKNIASDPGYASEVRRLKERLEKYEQALDNAPVSPREKGRDG